MSLTVIKAMPPGQEAKVHQITLVKWSSYAWLSSHNYWAILTALAITNVAFSQVPLTAVVRLKI